MWTHEGTDVNSCFKFVDAKVPTAVSALPECSNIKLKKITLLLKEAVEVYTVVRC
jgi:hypothetical protein